MDTPATPKDIRSKQRFEYTFELAWKCRQDGLISYGLQWMERLKARNATTHLYDQATFDSVLAGVKGKFLNMLQTFETQFPGT